MSSNILIGKLYTLSRSYAELVQEKRFTDRLESGSSHERPPQTRMGNLNLTHHKLLVSEMPVVS
jgi:hypothetical protein